ncbi:glycosyltransferase [Paenibacillus pinihumi]|uniref:glycosyltransferase n=1 Tax=Paenibacillus pinihumi TaxID=669462 RepID=UPI00040EBC1B|nr:glycosyltransferase [Paenibacillus pinihumi]
MSEGIDYFIVAPTSWDKEGLKYRRHRLTELLQSKESTRHIYWIYPDHDSFTSISVQNHPKVTQISLPYGRGMFRYVGNMCNAMIHSPLKPYLAESSRKVLFYTYPYFSQLIGLSQWERVIYDCSDYWCGTWVPKTGLRGMVQQFKAYMIRRTENQISSRVNLGFATSEFLARHIHQQSNKNFKVIENGVEFDLFTQVPPVREEEIEQIQGVKLGFVGGLKAKIDYELLLEVSKQKPEWNLLLIGPAHGTIEDFEALKGRPNIFFLGGKSPDAVPGYMKRLDVGLMPYKNIAYNRAVSPLKMFEYMAAEIPVVGCGLPTTDKYQEPGVYYHTDCKAEAFIQACEQALQLKDKEIYRLKRIRRAQENDWQTKLESIYRSI